MVAVLSLLGLAVAILIAVAIFLYFYDVTVNEFYEKMYAGKGPEYVPFFGHTFRMKTTDLAELNKQHQNDVRDYGSPVKYKFGHYYLFHISTPEHFEAIMKHTTNIAKPVFYGVIHQWLKAGLLTSEGKKWQSRRKLLTPAFHFQILREFCPVFNEHSDQLVHYLRQKMNDKPNSFVDMVPILTMSTLDIICETAMGRSVGALEGGESSPYTHALLEVSDTLVRRVYSNWLMLPDSLYNFFTEDGRRTSESLKVLHGFTREVITEREGDLPSSEELKEGGKRRLVFLDLLLDMKRQGVLSLDDVAEETDTFMFEGHDTTAAALMWCVYLLGYHKEHQRLCQEEIDRQLAGTGADVTSEQLSRLSYLDRCVKETQRMYPSVPLIGRRVDQEMKLDDQYILKPGSNIQMNVVMLHRDPKHWPNPEKFDPDRFLPENTAKRHPFAFVPFSAGARNCIGQKFAITELKTIMVHLLRNFNWTTRDNPHDSVGAMLLVLRPEHGVWLQFQDRD